MSVNETDLNNLPADVQNEIPASNDVQPEGQEQITQEEVSDWTKDKRYLEMWKQDPNNLYKSYKEIEPEWAKSREVLKQHGLKDFDGLAEKLKLIQEYENPENPKNLLYDHLNEIASNEKYRAMLVNAFQEIQQQQARDKWGESTPPELIQKLEELDNYKSMFEQQEQERTFNTEVEKIQTSLTSAFENVFNLAEQYKVDLDIQAFIDHCQENKIAPEYIEAEFLKQSLPNILKAKEIQSAESVQKNLQNNAKGGISTASKTQPQGSKTTTQDRLDGFFKKYGYE